MYMMKNKSRIKKLACNLLTIAYNLILYIGKSQSKI